ncbi:patatin-like phospholipase family protein [Anaerorhabdus furcosa]|uniref:Predicted phospholipase, patatin/cPLA2 family n=1 Tax=Anaerorhabdus furcosa TaxID=118967 RepID=A0A1T4JV29_9FIRM|nr:patatin family protein [Anaerorhabdus furcosa]SJZ34008.1 Predicted phospholipase, patatin/cPLA2 family [Anaerorhabdus furcosa]
MSKYGLVLEGGGMRGAYTAGALAWLVDNNIEFDYGVGISAGAVNLCSYLLKSKEYLHDITVKYTSDKKNVGLIPLLKEHRYVGYDYMFDHLLRDEVKYDTSPIKDKNMPMEFGVYDMNQEKTIFFNAQDLDPDLRMLKASCSLPIAGRIVDYNGYRFLDGGISIMIPIERSIEAGCDKNMVIITKPEGYRRKAAGPFMQKLMTFNYRKYKKMVYDYTHRHESYNRQMELIEKEVKDGNCILIRPSETIPVKRFSGDPENLKKLYELGYKDMETRKEEILKFMQNKNHM